MLTFNSKSLSKHDITTDEVDEVLYDSQTIWLDIGRSRSGNDRLMFLGLTKSRRALEIGVELIGEDEYVFHAMDAGKHYLKEITNAR